jgi:FkbM family methyltransferase
MIRRAWFKLLSRPPVVTVEVAGQTLKFRVRTYVEYWRAKSLPEKEAGTIEWLAQNVRPDDLLCDVGANIGIYTVLAAALGARVAAFEPHVGNADSLVDNVALNGLSERVDVYSIALHDTTGFGPFNYYSLVRGTSQSQYRAVEDDSGNRFAPVGREMKWGVPFDSLGLQPDLVKIDVDGNEPAVLDGMAATLGATSRPRSVQVEVNARNGIEVRPRMERFGYRFDHRHETQAGKERLAAGVDPEQVAHNAVYVPGSDD